MLVSITKLSVRKICLSTVRMDTHMIFGMYHNVSWMLCGVIILTGDVRGSCGDVRGDVDKRMMLIE